METIEKKAVQNGAVKTKSVKKNVKAPAKIVVANNSLKANEEVKKEREIPKFSLEERIQKVEELRGLTLKRNVTVKTLNDLRTFAFTSDDSCKLEISDSTHKNFTTSNSNLINLLTNHLGALLKGKVTDLDEKIIEFEI